MTSIASTTTKKPATPPPTSFGQLQTQGQARPPSPGYQMLPQGQMPVLKAAQPNIAGAWGQMFTGAGQPQFQGGPQSTQKPGAYQGPGTFKAAKPMNETVNPMQSRQALPQVQQQGQFTAPQGGQQVDQRTMQSVMQALGNPSRYGSKEAGDTFDVLNRRLTAAGTADMQRINEDMASRGIHASTTAGGRLGDLATNLNQQRADFGTQIATDQARNYQTDRASAISQAMGYGGQQFSQGLEGFGANQQAGQQRFSQELDRGQFGLSQTGQNFGQDLASKQFGLNQNAQNFGQQAQQYGLNQGEAQNRFNAGMQGADFGLRQNNQNFNQGADRFSLNQGANQQGFNQQQQALQGLQGFGQQGFNNQMQTAGFNADQDRYNTDMMMRMLGMT